MATSSTNNAILIGTKKKKCVSQQVGSLAAKKPRKDLLLGGLAKTAINRTTAKLTRDALSQEEISSTKPRAKPEPDPPSSSIANNAAKKAPKLKKSTPQPDPGCSSSSTIVTAVKEEITNSHCQVQE
jgi:hypothetical protein